MDKEHTLEDFQTPVMGGKLYKEDGFYSPYIKKAELNWSTIISILIGEAGRWCRRFSSDLFVYLHSIQNKLDNGEFEEGTYTYLFGFREDGVDGNSFVLSKYNNSSLYGSASLTYRALWRLEISICKQTENRKGIEMRLMEVCR